MQKYIVFGLINFDLRLCVVQAASGVVEMITHERSELAFFLGLDSTAVNRSAHAQKCV